MVEIKHTRDRERHYRFGGPNGVEFEPGEHRINVDEEVANRVVGNFDDLEYVDDSEAYSRRELEAMEWADLQELAAESEDERIDGNSSREEIIDLLAVEE